MDTARSQAEARPSTERSFAGLRADRINSIEDLAQQARAAQTSVLSQAQEEGTTSAASLGLSPRSLSQEVSVERDSKVPRRSSEPAVTEQGDAVPGVVAEAAARDGGLGARRLAAAAVLLVVCAAFFWWWMQRSTSGSAAAEMVDPTAQLAAVTEATASDAAAADPASANEGLASATRGTPPLERDGIADNAAAAQRAADSVPLTDPSLWSVTEDNPAPPAEPRISENVETRLESVSDPSETALAEKRPPVGRRSARSSEDDSTEPSAAAGRPEDTTQNRNLNQNPGPEASNETEVSASVRGVEREGEVAGPGRPAASEGQLASVALDRAREAFASGDLRAIQRGMETLRAVPRDQRTAAQERAVNDLERAAAVAPRWGLDPEAEIQGMLGERLGEAALLSRSVPQFARRAGVTSRTRELVERDFTRALASGDLQQLDRILRAAEQYEPLSATVRELRSRQRTALGQQSRERLEDRLRTALRRSTPHQVLDEIDALPPTRLTGLQELVEQVRQRLVELDTQAPALSVDSLSDVDFAPGQDLDLRLRAQDDYEVVLVELFVRGQGSSGRDFAPVQVRFLGGRVFAATIPQELHGDRAIQLYGVARDRSGHEGLLGSARSPVRLKPR